MDIQTILAILGFIAGGSGLIPWIKLYRSKTIDKARDLKEISDYLEEAYDTILKLKTVVIELQMDNKKKQILIDELNTRIQKLEDTIRELNGK